MSIILAFLGSRAAPFIGGAALVLLLLGGIYLKGYADGSRRAEATCAAATAAAVAKVQKANTESLEAEKARNEATEKALAASQALVESLTEDVRRRPPASVCTVEKGDVEKLKAIR